MAAQTVTDHVHRLDLRGLGVGGAIRYNGAMGPSIAGQLKCEGGQESVEPGVGGGAAAPSPVALTWWERVSFGIAHTVVSVLLLGLGLRGLYRFGELFATIEWVTNYRRRRRFARALARILGRRPTGRERRFHSRRFFVRTRCDKLFYLIFDRLGRGQAAGLLSIPRKDVLEGALGKGRGLYLALSHHGAQHVLAMFFALLGYRPVGVRDRKESALRRYVQARFDGKYPEFGRMRVLYADSFPREIFRCLREGYVVGSAMDVSRVRSDNQRTQEVRVFGERRWFLSGPVRVAMRCKTPVLQAFVISEPGFRYRLEIVGILFDPDRDKDDQGTLSSAMQTYAANVERFITDSPHQLSRI